MTKRHVYQAYGISIASDVELPLERAAVGEPDIEFREDRTIPLSDSPLSRRADDVIASLGSDEDPWYVASKSDDGVQMSFRRTAEFALEPDLRTVRWRMHPGSDQGMLPILLSGTVLALNLILRDHLVLHASAVGIDDRAIAFVGHSGKGKSTLAALGAAHGGQVVSDDVLVVEGSDPPRCLGNGGELRLRPAAHTVGDLLPGQPGRRETSDDRLALLAAERYLGAIELDTIVVPSPSREVDEVRVERIAPSLAVFWLTTFPRVTGLALDGVVQTQFEKLAKVCAHVPVYNVTIPWGPPFDPTVFGRMLELIENERSSSH